MWLGWLVLLMGLWDIARSNKSGSITGKVAGVGLVLVGMGMLLWTWSGYLGGAFVAAGFVLTEWGFFKGTLLGDGEYSGQKVMQKRRMSRRRAAPATNAMRSPSSGLRWPG